MPFRKYLSYAFKTILLVMVFSLVISISGYKFANEVIINGSSIGFVLKKGDFYQTINEIKEQILTFKKENADSTSQEKDEIDDYLCGLNPVFLGRILSYKNLTPSSTLKFNLMSKIDKLFYCHSLVLNDVAQFGVMNLSTMDEILEKHKNKFSAGEVPDDSIVAFDKKVSVEKRFLPIFMIRNSNEALNFLSKKVSEQIDYVCSKDDTLDGIATKNNTTVEKLIEINGCQDSGVKEGQKLKIDKNGPLLGVNITKKIEYIEEIPYEVKNVEDENLKEGIVNVVSGGVNGKNKVFAKLLVLNGEEVSKEILRKEIIKEPESQIQKIGKKQITSVAMNGNFLNPTGGRLTSRFGMRWGRQHEGIDIGAPFGTIVKASADGVIKFASWRSGYGNYVLIDHENGYETGYGHNSLILVRPGQKVKKGDAIAKIGSTGRSTGPHLHFEIKKNGVFIDPLKYVSY